MPAGFQFPISAKLRDIWINAATDSEVDTPGDTPMAVDVAPTFCEWWDA